MRTFGCLGRWGNLLILQKGRKAGFLQIPRDYVAERHLQGTIADSFPPSITFSDRVRWEVLSGFHLWASEKWI